MDAKSEVILRHDHWQGRILLVNPPQDQLFQSLQNVGATQISVWTWNFADHSFLTIISKALLMFSQKQMIMIKSLFLSPKLRLYSTIFWRNAFAYSA